MLYSCIVSFLSMKLRCTKDDIYNMYFKYLYEFYTFIGSSSLYITYFILILCSFWYFILDSSALHVLYHYSMVLRQVSQLIHDHREFALLMTYLPKTKILQCGNSWEIYTLILRLLTSEKLQ